MNAARVALFVLVALAVAVTANIVLLGIASGPRDPVGRLTPQAGLVLLPTPTTPAQPPATTTTTTTTVTTTTTTATTPSSPTPPGSRDGEHRGGSQHADD